MAQNSVGPVDIDFVLKNVNIDQETKRMKEEIASVGVTAEDAARRVGASLGSNNARFAQGAQGVNQYARSVSSLSFSMQQVARELPSLALSPQMFMLAISNNLPILADNIKRVREENALLKAANQQTVPVYKQIISSIFSWQTGLVALITILTVFGKDIFNGISNLFKFRNELSLTSEELKKLNADFAKNAGSELGQLQYLFDQLSKAKKGSSEYLDAKAQIIKQYGPYLSGLGSEITTLDNVRLAYDALTKSIYESAKAKSLKGTYEQLGQNLVDQTTKQLATIYDQLTGKYGENAGSAFFEQIKAEIEAGKGLSYEMKRVIKDAIRSEPLTDEFGVVIRTIEVDRISKAISDIAKAKAEFQSKIAEARRVLDTKQGGDTEQVTSLIETQQQLLEQARLLPEATEEEIRVKNRKIEAIENEIKRLRELGKANKDGKTIEDEIKKVEDKMLTAQGDELNKLAAKLVLLQRELELRRQIANASILKIIDPQTDAAVKLNQTIPGKGLSPIIQEGSISTKKGIVYEVTAIDKTGPTWEKMKGEISKLKKFEKDKYKEADKEQEKLDKEREQKKQKIENDLLNASREFTNELSRQLGLSESQTFQLQKSVEIIQAAATGNWFSVGASAFSLILSTITSENVNQAEITNEQIEKTNELLSLQGKLLDVLKGSDYYQAAYDRLKQINTELITYEQKLRDISVFDSRSKRKIDTSDFTYEQWVNLLQSDIYSGFNSDNLKAILDQIFTLKNEAANAQSELFSSILGFDASDISDTIISGIEDGLKTTENGLGSFAESFGEKIRTALVKNITDAMNIKLTEGFMSDFNTYMSDGALSEQERKTLEEEYRLAVADANARYEAIRPILEQYGTSATKRSAMTGIAAGATEDSVSALVGQIMAARVDIQSLVKMASAGNDSAARSLMYMKQIADNSEYLKKLVVLETEMKQMNTHLSKMA